LVGNSQKSLIQTLVKEVNRTGIKVYELILGPMKTRDRIKHGHGQDEWYFPEEIGDYIRRQILMNQDEVVHYSRSRCRCRQFNLALALQR
jgi:hypothetical protein